MRRLMNFMKTLLRNMFEDESVAVSVEGEEDN